MLFTAGTGGMLLARQAALVGRATLPVQAPVRTFASAWDLAGPSTSASTASNTAGRPKRASTAALNAAEGSNVSSASSSEGTPIAHSGNGFDSASIPPVLAADQDWSASFHGLGAEPFPKEIADVLLAPLDPESIEIKPGEWRFMPIKSPRSVISNER